MKAKVMKLFKKFNGESTTYWNENGNGCGWVENVISIDKKEEFIEGLKKIEGIVVNKTGDNKIYIGYLKNGHTILNVIFK